MAIKRYLANADNTITNAYKANLSTRGTGSNMGESDVLEVFSILGQASTSSVEKARALVQFPISDISTDRTNGDIPLSGNVKFFLRMFNCPHGQTLPKKFDMHILPLSRSWTEGQGLDMEEYSDEGVSNWIMASTTKQPHITDIKILTATKGNLRQKYFSLHNADNKRYNFWFQQSNGSTFSGSVSGQEVVVPITGSDVTTVRHIAQVLRRAINNANSATAVVAGAESIGLSASISFEDTGDSTGATIRVTTTGSKGISGSFQGTVDASHLTLTTAQFGGKTRWTTQGGDYHEVGYTAGRNLPHYMKNFQHGTENLELNITALVEEWIAAESTVDPDRENYGIILKMSGAYEDGSLNRSYYTKKFFARGSEFFYKRPQIEARWDDSKRDDRNNFFRSSSLASGDDNLNTIYLYNYVRGQLRNIPVLGGNSGSNDAHTQINLQIFPSGNIKNQVIKAKTLPIGGGVSVDGATVVTGGWVSTGIYSASFAFTGSESEVFEVWSKPSKVSQGIQLVTGSVFKVKKMDSLVYNPSTSYVTTIKNLKSSYSQSDKARFRLFIRPKDWQPNIYTVASNTVEPTTIDNAYYRVFRIIDEFEVLPFGTGSGAQNKYTRLSYDKDGNYFDLEMSIFESGCSYGIQFAYDVDGRYVVQDKVFKFRVDR